MLRKCFLFGVVILALFLVGCASTTRYEFLGVTSNDIGSKVGEAPVSTTGNKNAGLAGGIYQAAKNGGITKIAVVEKRITVGGPNAGVFIVVTGE